MPYQGPVGPVLTIGFNEEGAVQVNGPLDDKMLCYALLEQARDAIKDFNDKHAIPEPKIQPASPTDIRALTRRVQ